MARVCRGGGRVGLLCGTRVDFRECFARNYGPTTRSTGRSRTIGSAPPRSTLDAFAARSDRGRGSLEWEYLLLTATKRG